MTSSPLLSLQLLSAIQMLHGSDFFLPREVEPPLLSYYVTRVCNLNPPPHRLRFLPPSLFFFSPWFVGEYPPPFAAESPPYNPQMTSFFTRSKSPHGVAISKPPPSLLWLVFVPPASSLFDMPPLTGSQGQFTSLETTCSFEARGPNSDHCDGFLLVPLPSPPPNHCPPLTHWIN